MTTQARPALVWVAGVGASAGLGAALARRFAREGLHAVLTGSNRERLEQVAAEIRGTGASAVCVAGVLSGQTDRKITIHLLGGDLQLEWNAENNHVSKTGPAAEVFSGNWHG